MKKALVVLLALAVVGGAFAADLSGVAIGNVVPVQGSTAKDSKIAAGGGMGVIRIQGAGENENGTFGGWVRMTAGTEGATPRAYGLAWWKPIEQFKFQIGGNPDGFLAVNEITGWGFHTDAGDAGVAMEGWAFGSSLYGGTPVNGALLTITPMEALAINIGIPFFGKENDGAVTIVKNDAGNVTDVNGIDNVLNKGFFGTYDTAEETYKRTHAQVAYTIDSIGRIAVTYAGNLMGKLGDEDQALDTGSTIYGSFLLTAVENLTVNLGVGFTTPVDNSNGKRSAPIAVGLGADFNTGTFGVKGRVQGKFAGSTTISDVTVKDDMNIIADVMPYFAIDDTFKVFVNLGLNVGIPAADGGKTVLGWQVNPYISKSVTGGGLFFAGLQVSSAGGTDAVIKWGVPMGMVYSW